MDKTIGISEDLTQIHWHRMTLEEKMAHIQLPFLKRYPHVPIPEDTKIDLQRITAFLQDKFYSSIDAANSIRTRGKYHSPKLTLETSLNCKATLDSGLTAILLESHINPSRQGRDLDNTLINYPPSIDLEIHVQRKPGIPIDIRHRTLQISLGLCTFETENDPFLLFQAQEQIIGTMDGFYADTFYQPFYYPAQDNYYDRGSVFYGSDTARVFGDKLRPISDIVDLYDPTLNVTQHDATTVLGEGIIHHAFLENISEELIEAINITASFLK